VIYPSAIVNSPSKPYIASVYLRGDIGGEKVKIVINEKDSGDNWVDETSSPEITLTTTWTQYNISKVFGATGYRSQILVLSTIKESGTFYADSFQLEQGTQITQWQLPVNPTYFSSLQNPTYTFTNSGNYTVYLNSSNSNGYNVSNQNTFINVSTGGGILPPVASFTINKNLLRIPNTITVTDTSTNIPTSWDWQWGDGTANSTTQNPTHTYTTRGKFNIYLTATNAGGSGSTATATSVRVVGYENYY
jgi:PKD repeat protein